ncbi:MAG: class I SAM-dependent methyltransferase [Desulfobacterales bacterium]|nr:class I SAM-dependent methyltransferase [Desulfobacterales bacterium]
MPTSHPNQINEIVQIAELLTPHRVLDVGIGNGKYGFLFREYLGNNRGLDKDQFVIDGIEGYEKYINDIHRHVYNNIHIQDLSEPINIDATYDLCILIDVIEHFERARGLELIEYFSTISEFLLITTPWNIGDPNIQHENPFQKHLYQWVKKDFRQFSNPRFIFNQDSLIVLIGNDKKKAKFVERKMQHRLFSKIYNYTRRALKLKKG